MKKSRRTGRIGFRVDVPDGSHVPNWRRKDFPNLSKVPKNVPADWWNKSLQENGGGMPPVPFPRASVTRRESGMFLLKTLRENLKKTNPDGVLLAELSGFPYMLECDFLYDNEISQWMMRTILRKTDQEEMVQCYMRLKYQDYYMEPRGTLSMRFTESHDQLTARGIAGIGMELAFLATAFLMSGIPMVYQDADNGLGIFLKELIDARRELPELRRGEDLYFESAVSSRSVFHLLRKDGERVSLALMNFSPRKQTVTVSVPQRFLLSGVNAADWRERKHIALEKSGKSVRFSIPPNPWAWTVAVFRETEEKRAPALVTVSPPAKTAPGQKSGVLDFSAAPP